MPGWFGALIKRKMVKMVKKNGKNRKMVISRLKKSAPECPFELGKFFFKNGQCPNRGGDLLKWASLNLLKHFGDFLFLSIVIVNSLLALLGKHLIQTFPP